MARIMLLFERRMKRVFQTVVKGFGVVLAVGVAGMAPRSAAQSATPYSLIILNDFGIDYSDGHGVNNKGQVVGSYGTNTNGNRPYVYRDGVLTDLGTLGGAEGSDAFGINDSGQIVGQAQTTEGSGRAFLYANGAMTNIDTLDSYYGSFARSINTNGLTVGSFMDNSFRVHAFLYSSGQMTELNTLIPTNSGWFLSEALCVNDGGQIVGNGVINGATHGYVFSNGVVTDLGTLGGGGSYANGINNIGQIVGSAATSNGVQHAFLYDNGTMIDLLPLGGSSRAKGINNRGDVVGYDEGHAFLYSGGTMADLNTLVASNSFTLTEGFAISDNGQIVGEANPTSSPSSYFAFFLTPRPVLQNFRFDGGSAFFDLHGMTGINYRVEYSSFLPATNWFTLTNLVLGSSTSTVVDPTASTSAQRFYRAVQTH